MAKVQSVVKYEKPSINRKGVHSKSKTSSLKTIKNNKKSYKGQCR